MPPVLSPPSVRTTMAPSGMVPASAAICFRLSPMRVALSSAASPRAWSMRTASFPNSYRRTWNLLFKSGSSCVFRRSSAFCSRGFPSSAMPMLREWSIRTATTFCCGRRRATLIAGCHNISRTKAIRAVWASQMTIDRAFVSSPCRRRIFQKRPPPAAAISSTRSQTGHPDSSTNLPFSKMDSGYLNRNSNIVFSTHKLVGHRIYDVINTQAVCLRCIFRFVLRIVRVFPCIAVVLIETHRHHHAPLIVVDCAPMRDGSVLFRDSMAVEVLEPRHLDALIQIIHRVEDRVGIGQFDDHPVGENPAHALGKD